MRTEIYSVRSNTQEISYINKNLKKIATAINERANIKILFKTEIDANAKKIKKELNETFLADNPPELYIFLNALNTKDISSFYSLFSPFIEGLEKDLRKQNNSADNSYPHIQIHTIEGLPGGYPAYCFTFKRRKYLVLPRMSLTGAPIVNYVSEAVLRAKQIYSDNFGKYPDGYIYCSEKPVSAKERFKAYMAKNKKAPETNEVVLKPESKESAPAVSDKTNPPVEIHLSAPEETPVNTPAEISVNTPAEIPEETPAKTQENNTPSKEKKQKKAKASKEKSEEKKSEDVNLSKNYKNKKNHTDKKADNKNADKKEKSEKVIPAPEIEDENKAEEKENKKESSFISFIKSFIPMKGDSKKNLILKIIVLVAIVVFLVGAFLLLKFYIIDPTVNNNDIKEIQSIFYSDTAQTYIEEITDEQGNVKETVVVTAEKEKSKNWKGVQKINKEIVSWVKLKDTKIDYPVLYHKGDNEESQYYLYKNYKKEYSDFGSIFLDFRSGADARHVVLHGHNMGSDKDAMFGSLIRYTIKDGRTQANTDYYKSHAIINYDTPKEDAEWVIFAAMKIDVSNDKDNVFNYLQCEFENHAQYMNFIYNIKERSYFDVNIPINEADRLLTLSTCSYESDNMRTVIVARQVRDGEDVSKYIKAAKGKSPVYSVNSDFTSEFKNIKWYDGTGKPKGDGTLEFMEQREMFTVKFYDAYDKVIRTEQVIKGEDAVGIIGAPPEKKSDDTYSYKFIKWDTDYKKVTKNLEVRPVYQPFLLEPPTNVQNNEDPTPTNPPVNNSTSGSTSAPDPSPASPDQA